MKREFRQLRLSQLDRSLELVRSLMPRPSGGWIASVREALGLSQRQVGKKMRASGQAIQQFEKAEAEDRITLRALRRVAGTMGCELVYALVPKSGSFAELAEQPSREQAARDVKSVVHTMATSPAACGMRPLRRRARRSPSEAGPPPRRAPDPGRILLDRPSDLVGESRGTVAFLEPRGRVLPYARSPGASARLQNRRKWRDSQSDAEARGRARWCPLPQATPPRWKSS